MKIGKKITLLPNVNDNQKSCHQKANTQSINIYNILHKNDPDKKQPHESSVAFHLEKTYDVPMKLRHTKPKNDHEAQLEAELKEYQAEVEFKFNNSKANKNYVFPRNISDANEDKNEYRTSLLISIYDRELLKEKIRESSEGRKSKIIIIKKSHSQEKTHSKSDPFRNFLKRFIKPDLIKIKNQLPLKQTEVEFNRTQKLLCENRANESAQSYLFSNTQMNKKKSKLEHQANSEATETDSQNIKLNSIKTYEGTYNVKYKKKPHYRTHTIGTIDKKNIKNILNAKKLGKDIDTRNSKNNSRTMHLSGYFKSMIGQKTQPSQSTNKMRLVAKSKDRDQFNNTLSLATFFNKGKHRIAITHNRKKI